jgi:hypothetical protein
LHVLVHEYGHHVDNQLANLAHRDMGCSVANDGSRNWFFTREADDSLLGAGMSCAPDAGWGRALGELYAEDYTWLHGNRFWRSDLPVRAPGEWHLEALASDMAVPFARQTRRRTMRFERRGSRFVSVNLDHWTFFSARLTGRRAADLDLYLRKANARRVLERSRGDGSRERVERVLPPGRYEVEIVASAQSGRGTLRLLLD